MFTGRYGTPIDPRTLNRAFTARCDAAGVRRLTVHDARRTCATLLVDLDVHPRVIMRVLRHADQGVTMKIYAKASSARHERPYGGSGRASTEAPLLYFAAVLASAEGRGLNPVPLTRAFAGGRYWVRTSDLFGVNEARYHCANRPRRAPQGVENHISSGRRVPNMILVRLRIGIGSGALGERTADSLRTRPFGAEGRAPPPVDALHVPQRRRDEHLVGSQRLGQA